MSGALSTAVAVTFLWLGMVLAISFLEAPLKFRAPGVTVPIGLGIGRLVFRALNAAEVLFAVAVLCAIAADPPPTRAVVVTAVAVAALLLQLVLVRPSLTRRSEAVLAGGEAPRSHAHHAYIALETVKTLALIVGGVLLLAG